MKKVGILTFWKSYNYGSALQAYALAYKLKELGFVAEIINYTQYNFGYNYGLFWFPASKMAIKGDLIHLCFWKSFKNRKKAFKSFSLMHLPLGRVQYQCNGNLDRLSSFYDVVICGSDQIWNPNAKDFDINYFLPEVQEIKKISYAVSLNGGDLYTRPDYRKLRSCLLDFDALSVREESGKQNLRAFLGENRKINVSLDPTLLHGRHVYDAIASVRRIAHPYIFLYTINFNRDVLKAAEVLSIRLGFPVYTYATGRGNKGILYAGKSFSVMNQYLSPCDFISMIRDAQYVVTNSFHGTAFSVIYEKLFYAIGCKGADGKIEYDERICDGLKMMGLYDRFITAEQMETVNLNIVPDFETAWLRRREEAERSVAYLIKAIR